MVFTLHQPLTSYYFFQCQCLIRLFLRWRHCSNSFHHAKPITQIKQLHAFSNEIVKHSEVCTSTYNHFITEIHISSHLLFKYRSMNRGNFTHCYTCMYVCMTFKAMQHNLLLVIHYHYTIDTAVLFNLYLYFHLNQQLKRKEVNCDIIS